MGGSSAGRRQYIWFPRWSKRDLLVQSTCIHRDCLPGEKRIAEQLGYPPHWSAAVRALGGPIPHRSGSNSARRPFWDIVKYRDSKQQLLLHIWRGQWCLALLGPRTRDQDLVSYLQLASWSMRKQYGVRPSTESRVTGHASEFPPGRKCCSQISAVPRYIIGSTEHPDIWLPLV